MILYIDESGNTGETLSKEMKFNFREQPYYTLTGVLLKNERKDDILNFITNQKIKHRIQGNELKAKNIYDSSPEFVSDLVEFIISNKIPFFIELMDKLYYLDVMLVEYFIVPYYSLEINNSTLSRKRFVSSTIGLYLNENIYETFTNTVKENTNEALEKFYEVLIDHFEGIKAAEIKKNVELTRDDYFDQKKINPVHALRNFLPIPDENPNKRLIHLLPNYNAFTNLLGRVQKFIDDNEEEKFKIIHDNQEQFGIIFQSALETMKKTEIDATLENTQVADKAKYKIDPHTSLEFVDSKTNTFIQIADLLSGIVMRFWNDYENDRKEKINLYAPIIRKLIYPFEGSTVGINFVVPDHKHSNFIKLIKKR